MALDVWGKIEHVRRQPESVRMRYVMGCLVISMLFIFGIWILSVREGFRNVGKGMPQALEEGKGTIPKGSATPSLGDMLKDSTPLRVEDKEKTGQQFFDEQIEKRDVKTEVLPGAGQ